MKTITTIDPKLKPAPDEAYFSERYPDTGKTVTKCTGRAITAKEFKIQQIDAAERWARRPISSAEMPLTVKQVSMGRETITSVYNNLGQLIARR